MATELNLDLDPCGAVTHDATHRLAPEDRFAQVADFIAPRMTPPLMKHGPRSTLAVRALLHLARSSRMSFRLTALVSPTMP